MARFHRPLLAVFGAGVLAIGCAGGGVERDPRALARIPVDPAAYPGANGIYLFYDETHGQTPAGTHEIHHEVYRVLRDGGLTMADRTIKANSWVRIEIEQARVIRPDGTAVDLPSSAITKGQDGVLHWKRVQFPDVSVGCTIDFQYSVRHDLAHQSSETTLYSSKWIPILRDDPILHWRLLARYPSATLSTVLCVHVSEKIDQIMYLRPDGQKETQYTIKLSNLPGLSSEALTPDRTDARHLPQTFISNFGDWNKVAWYEGEDFWLLQKTDAEFDSAVAKIVLGSASPEEQVERLFRHVAQTMRWVESAPASTYLKMSKAMPRTPLEILPSGFASPEERSRLLLAMLQQIGIKAMQVYVRPGSARAIPEQVPLYEFPFSRRLIAYPADDGKLRYLDPAPRFASTKYLRTDVQGHNVFVVSGRQSGKIETVPTEPIEKTMWDESGTVQLDASGSGEIRAEASLSGEFAGSYRERFADAPAKAAAAFAWAGASSPKIAARNPEALDDALRVSIEGKAAGIGTASSDAISVVPLTRLPSYASLPEAPRRYPIQLDHLYVRKLKYTVKAPAGWKATKVPDNAKIESKFGFGICLAKYALAGNDATFDIVYSQPVYQLRADGYGEFVKHWKAVAAAAARPIVFEKNR